MSEENMTVSNEESEITDSDPTLEKSISEPTAVFEKSVSPSGGERSGSKSKIIAVFSTVGAVALLLLGIFVIYPLVSFWTGNYWVYIDMYSVKEFEIPEGVTEIKDDQFAGCNSLERVTIPNSVTKIGDCAFHSCDNLEQITIPDAVTSIGDAAFSYCEKLTSVTVPDSVTSIGKNAFFACHNLESITLPFVGENADGTSYTDFGHIFGVFDENSISLYIPSGLSDVTVTGGTIGVLAFRSCKNIKRITLGEGITQIDGAAFYNCEGLEVLRLPSTIQTFDDDAFVGCTSLKCLYIADVAVWCDTTFDNSASTPTAGVSEFYVDGELVSELVIPDGVTEIGNFAFYNLDGITSVVIPNSVTRIGNFAFVGCKNLESVVIGDGVVSIGEDAFSDCNNLTSITIPNTVTSIGDSAFRGCSGLTSITVPNSVTSIGDYAFEYCKSLTSIKYRGTEAEWNAITKGSSWDSYAGSYTITYNYTEE